MMLWIKATQMWLSGLCMAVAAFIAALTAGTELSVPSLSAQSWVGIPLAAIVAVVPASAVLGGWRRMPAGLRATASSLQLMTSVGLSTLAVLLVGVVLLGGLSELGGSGLQLIRNVLGLVGAGLLMWRAWGRDAALATPIAYALVACVFGSRGNGQSPQPWAWILNDSGDPVALVIAVSLALAGLLASAGTGRVDLARGADATA